MSSLFGDARAHLDPSPKGRLCKSRKLVFSAWPLPCPVSTNASPMWSVTATFAFAGIKKARIDVLTINQETDKPTQLQIHLHSTPEVIIYSTMAFNKLFVCAVFVAAFYFASAAPTAMYRLLSERSGLFVEALSDGDVHAKAAATGKLLQMTPMRGCKFLCHDPSGNINYSFILVHFYFPFFFFSFTVAATKFYLTLPEAGKFSFESVEYPGKYLLVDSGELKVGTPSNDNEKFTSTAIDTDTHAFHIPTDCYTHMRTDTVTLTL